MGPSGQWDVRGALAAAGLFRFLHGAGGGCVAPFLTLYLRHLGLPAALVGAVVGAKRLVGAAWAPLGSRYARGHRRGKALVAGSLLCAAGAGLLLALVPAATPRASDANAAPAERLRTATRAAAATTGARPTLAGFGFALPKTDRGAGEGGASTGRHAARPAALAPALEAVRRAAGMPVARSSLFAGLQKEMSGPAAVAVGLADNPEKSLPISESSKFPVFITHPPTAGGAYVSENLSDRSKEAQDVDFGMVQSTIFNDRKHQVFWMVLGAVMLWELLAAPVEWIVDDSLYEYLDFIDATDRYGKLWIWSYLGASGGACGIAVLVDRLNCFLSSNVSCLAVHFYGYALLMMLSLLASIFFPTYVPRKTKHMNKTAKALDLIGSDGQAILFTVTVFLTGVAGSTVQNFLFWQMEDQGSSEMYMGLSVAVGLIAELLLYFFKSKLLRALSSSGTVALSLSCLAAQLLYYSFLRNAWSVLLIQVLSAFSNGALWWAVDLTVDDVATPGMERSLRALLRGLSRGGGASLGSLAGGFVVGSFGLAVLYRACCICLVLWLCMFLIVQSKLPPRKKINYSRLLAADSSDVSDEERESDWLVKAMKDDSFSGSW
ncbi:major facilitator superfamily domain-containing protein 6-like [Rhea pennata]|uniref:major facilitator superfamily domain-containing protein 6-like n=1 Tax=Rhea pennata TaxID=8795 RepID=UPI002E261FB1